MRYWDSSAIVPVIIEEKLSSVVRILYCEDSLIVTWWGSVIECFSATSRRQREGKFKELECEEIRDKLNRFFQGVDNIAPSNRLRERALRLLATHAVRSQDALQLAAALIWSEDRPQNVDFVCLDHRLREFAANEGFSLLPK